MTLVRGIESLAANQLRDGSAFILDAPDEIPAHLGARHRRPLVCRRDRCSSPGPRASASPPSPSNSCSPGTGSPIPRSSASRSNPPTASPSTSRATGRARSPAACDAWSTAATPSSSSNACGSGPGPLPFDIVREPLKLTEFAQTFGATTLIIDSLKDIASPLSSDEVGSAVNRAIGSAHRQPASKSYRSTTTARRPPRTASPRRLADVYGSTWITSGAGSVISLWGDAGDPLVELAHLKQPADDVGPLELEHDHQHGITRRRERADAWTLLQASHERHHRQRRRRRDLRRQRPPGPKSRRSAARLERLVEDGHATRHQGSAAHRPGRLSPEPSKTAA